MQPSSSHAKSKTLPAFRSSVDKRIENTHTSPLTPAVTGISFPSPSETRSDRRRPFVVTAAPESSLHPSSSDDSVAPITPTDLNSLDQLWGSIRLDKERKMAKEPSKIKSFEGSSVEMQQGLSLTNVTPQYLKKQKSLAAFRESTDGRMVTARFDMPGIKKQDVHVSFQRTRLVVTWHNVTTTEQEEEGRVVRERKEKTYSQNIPLPEGTRFEEVRAAMDGRHLILRYPNMRSTRADSHSREYFYS